MPHLVCTHCVPLFCALFNRGGNRRAFRLPGAWNLRPVIFGVEFSIFFGNFFRISGIQSFFGLCASLLIFAVGVECGENRERENRGGTGGEPGPPKSVIPE